jgi:hypothetical protein
MVMPLSFGFWANVAAINSAASIALRSAGNRAEKNAWVVSLGFGIKRSFARQAGARWVSQPPAPGEILASLDGPLPMMGMSLRLSRTVTKSN